MKVIVYIYLSIIRYITVFRCVSKESLNAYSIHPEYLKAVDFIKSVVCKRFEVDC